ncbi:unnamed protein product [Tuber melanosporum]|uniref:(Perigord truffle) hypothetical protein n=1 Tax=Tuber melanosporum (strain Mel28) TaxID=656061 RepID=D5G4T5_TUBMM|nr:uncharacterized protein GSTUM_00000185001 [Tuber melanosporum]CAZ79528.1 unnamed protein product [Tuber melanosporum]
MSNRPAGQLTPGDCRPLLDQPELYGIGVRVGTYTQWLSTILTVCLVHDQEERATMRNVNYAFAFAEWVALVNQTRSIWPADGVIVTFLFMGTLTLLCMLEIFDRMRPRKSRREDPNLATGGEMARLTLLGAFVIWVIWWWFEGIYHTLRDCGTFIYYYGGPVQVLGNFKLIGRIWSPLLFLMFIPVLGKFGVFIRRSSRNFHILRDPAMAIAEGGAADAKAEATGAEPVGILSVDFWTQVFALEESEPYEPSIPNPRTKQRRGLYCALGLGIGVFILIIFLEIMLAYGAVDEINSISGVGDSVPMVIGCGDMLLILWKLKEQREFEMARVLSLLLVLTVRVSLIIC